MGRATFLLRRDAIGQKRNAANLLVENYVICRATLKKVEMLSTFLKSRGWRNLFAGQKCLRKDNIICRTMSWDRPLIESNQTDRRCGSNLIEFSQFVRQLSKSLVIIPKRPLRKKMRTWEMRKMRERWEKQRGKLLRRRWRWKPMRETTSCTRPWGNYDLQWRVVVFHKKTIR